MKTELQNIEEIITIYTATEYADMMVKKEKENFALSTFNSKTCEVKETNPSYYEYMKQMWHWEENPTLEECVQASRLSKLNQYAEAIEMYSGWVENGKIFVLNKKEGFVSFVFKLEKEDYTLNSKIKTVRIRTNYNPKNVDCIEESISPEYFNERICDEYYDISKNEKELNILCDKICECVKFK